MGDQIDLFYLQLSEEEEEEEEVVFVAEKLKMVVITEKTSVISSSSSSEVISSGVESSVTDVESVKTTTTTTTESVASLQLQPIINLDQGDPTMYEAYWKTVEQELKITISGSQSLSYFANPHSLCWFLLPHLDQHIKSLHHLVGNAVVEDRHIVVGNGSSQLIQAALYALSHPLDLPYPVNVVSPAPFYSCYPQIADLVRSGLFKWGGDASTYDKEEAYIEVVTSPNNPDGEMRDGMVKRENGMVVHDLAYYWPQYTSITAPADHDIMLFTVSKCTGHAGSRVGWALVKDAEVAKKMVKFMEISTIGVSKEAQHRAARVLEKIVAGYNGGEAKGFFEFGKSVMAERWRKLREALKGSEELLQLPEFPLQYCSFNKELNRARPAYAWLKCKQGIDLEKVLSQQKVRVRGGTSFGCGPEYVRVSMMGRDEDFASFIMKIPSILQLVAA